MGRRRGAGRARGRAPPRGREGRRRDARPKPFPPSGPPLGCSGSRKRAKSACGAVESGKAWRSVPAPQAPGRELRHSAGGHGCPVAATTSPSGAPPGAAATAPERAGSGSRFPAALGVPGARLLPAGETPPPRSRGAGAAGTLRAGRGAGARRGGRRSGLEAGAGRAGSTCWGLRGGSWLGHKKRAPRLGHAERRELGCGPGRRGSFQGEEIARRVLHNLTGGRWEGHLRCAPRFGPGDPGSGRSARDRAELVRKGRGVGTGLAPRAPCRAPACPGGHSCSPG